MLLRRSFTQIYSAEPINTKARSAAQVSALDTKHHARSDDVNI
jgi:hypothetical protein